MSRKHTISHRILREIALLFDEEEYLEKSGQLPNLGISVEEAGKQDRLMQEIRYRHDGCKVRLVLSDKSKALPFLIRPTTKCVSGNTALITVYYMPGDSAKRNGIASRCSMEDLRLCTN